MLAASTLARFIAALLRPAPRCSHLLVQGSQPSPVQSSPHGLSHSCQPHSNAQEKRNNPDPAQIHLGAPSKRLMPSCHHPKPSGRKPRSSPSPPHGSKAQRCFQCSYRCPPLHRYFKALFSFKESSSRRGRWKLAPTASRSPESK